MSRETVGYVKLEWTCPKCGSRNPGPEKTCLSCGAPQPPDVQFVQAAGELATQDEKLKEIAEKGADIHCGFCGARNPADASICSQCGGDLKEGMQRTAGKVVGAYKAEPVKQIPCPNCGAENPETETTCSKCGAPLQRAPAVQEALTPPDVTPKNRPNVLMIVIAGALLLLCVFAVIGLIYASSARESLEGTVQSVEWQTSVAIEALGPVTRQTWQDEIPQNAQMGSCSDRVYTVVDTEPAGEKTNKVCGTPYTVDTGSGVGQVVQDCRFEVYKPYCEYTTQEWQIIDEARLSGEDLNPAFANPQLASEQRLGTQNAEYVVLFETEKGQYRYRVSSLGEFRQFSIGSEWLLNINAFGQIVSVEPKQ